MPNRSRSESKDVNILAKFITEQATKEPTEIEPSKETPLKNPNAVALGRLGGLKGGKARAEKLSAKKRKEIAKKGAMARWGK